MTPLSIIFTSMLYHVPYVSVTLAILASAVAVALAVTVVRPKALQDTWPLSDLCLWQPQEALSQFTQLWLELFNMLLESLLHLDQDGGMEWRQMSYSKPDTCSVVSKVQKVQTMWNLHGTEFSPHGSWLARSLTRTTLGVTRARPQARGVALALFPVLPVPHYEEPNQQSLRSALNAALGLWGREPPQHPATSEDKTMQARTIFERNICVNYFSVWNRSVQLQFINLVHPSHYKSTTFATGWGFLQTVSFSKELKWCWLKHISACFCQCMQNIVQAETEAVALNGDPSVSAPGPPAAALMTWLQKDLSPPWGVAYKFNVYSLCMHVL